MIQMSWMDFNPSTAKLQNIAGIIEENQQINAIEIEI